LKQEVGMLVLGSFSNDIIFYLSKHNQKLEIEALVQRILQQLNDPQIHPIVLCRTLLTVT